MLRLDVVALADNASPTEVAEAANKIFAENPLLASQNVTFGKDRIYVLYKEENEPTRKEAIIKAINLLLAKLGAQQAIDEIEYRFWQNEHLMKRGGTGAQDDAKLEYDQATYKVDAVKARVHQARQLIAEVESGEYAV